MVGEVIRHRDGKFRARPARIAAPLCVARVKSLRVSKGNRTRAANARALIMAKLMTLRLELGL